MKTQDSINWTETANRLVNEKIEEILFLIKDGIEKEKSIEIVLAASCLSQVLKNKIIQEVQS